MFNRPIPKIPLLKKAELKFNFKDEEFIELCESEKIIIQMQYYNMNIPNAPSKCLMRKSVYKMLKRVADRLPVGYKLKILDAYRPLEVQKYLCDFYYDKIKKQYSNLNESELREKAKYFIASPDKNEVIAPAHSTGGAVDLTLIDENGNELDMGCKFDSFGPEAYTYYYEQTDNEKVKTNRRLLYNLMISEGFTNLPSEWWHYDFGTQNYARYKGEPILYKGVFDLVK